MQMEVLLQLNPINQFSPQAELEGLLGDVSPANMAVLCKGVP